MEGFAAMTVAASATPGGTQTGKTCGMGSVWAGMDPPVPFVMLPGKADDNDAVVAVPAGGCCVSVP
jgi:hypothetical protein